MAPNNYHRVASVTKFFTATAILQMAAESRVGLDDFAARFVPEEFRSSLAGITVRHLLNHTSGLAEPELLLFPSIREGSLDSVHQHARRALDPRTLVRLALGLAPPFRPGEQYWYSNTNYHVLGLVLETVAGEDAYDIIESNVIARAGLTHTYFPRGHGVVHEPTSLGYDSLYQHVEPAATFSAYDMSCVYTAGALISTPGDLNRFFAALLGGHLLPQRELTAMQATTPIADGVEMGLGIQQTTTEYGSFWASEGTFFGAQTVAMATADGTGSWAMTLNTTKYQALGSDGWPIPHPADAAIAALGAELSKRITER